MIVVTTDTVPGKEILEVKGAVTGSYKDSASGYSNDNGKRQRDGALASLEWNAEQLGANAVVGLEITTTSMGGPGWDSVEVLAYGTAVVIAD